MIIIEYTFDLVENEPGPNLYWKGRPEDYLILLNDLHVLGKENGIIINLEKYDYLDLIGIKEILLISSSESKTLCKIKNEIVTIKLDSTIWREILIKFLVLSFAPCHSYIEYDLLSDNENNLVEEANIIVSSEWGGDL